MTRIYEALQAAGKERVLVGRRSAVEPIRVAAPDELEECMLSVYRRIEGLLEGKQSRIVAFVGIPGGEDSARLVNLLARAAAYRLFRKVLLLSADLKTGADIVVSGERLRGFAREARLSEGGRSAAEPVLVTRRVSALELALPFMQGARDLESPIAEWREHFNLILLDVPPLGTSTGTEILCSIADGVVLVVEAGKARWQAVRHGMERIAGLDGRVLGAILNRQRHYIPDFLYRLL
jgi:Mrp family chromosome partitioning ATPase